MAAQAGLLLYLLIAPVKAAQSVMDAYTSSHGHPPNTGKINTVIIVTRWTLLGFLALEIVAVVLVLLLECSSRCQAKGQHSRYEPFEEDEQGYKAHIHTVSLKLKQIREDVERGDGSGPGPHAKNPMFPPFVEKTAIQKTTELSTCATPKYRISPYRLATTARKALPPRSNVDTNSQASL